MSEFFAMGGYGLYIWPCFIATVIVLGGLALVSWLGWKRQTALFERLQAEPSPAPEGPSSVVSSSASKGV
ncbi:MAG: heme exporter protein CcmD [Parvibaculaceae bacterium]|jgi:heme exporter protein CcmD|nr:heme exporter protein CcmD [Parvibaculaceae bacterium]